MNFINERITNLIPGPYRSGMQADIYHNRSDLHPCKHLQLLSQVGLYHVESQQQNLITRCKNYRILSMIMITRWKSHDIYLNQKYCNMELGKTKKIHITRRFAAGCVRLPRNPKGEKKRHGELKTLMQTHSTYYIKTNLLGGIYDNAYINFGRASQFKSHQCTFLFFK